MSICLYCAVDILPQRKVPREALDVVHAGPTPTVDRLTRIADSQDGMSTPEDALEQFALGNRCVLILVEQNRRVSSSEFRDHLREACDDLPSQSNLVSEVDDLSHGLLGSPLVHQICHHGSAGGCREHVSSDHLQATVLLMAPEPLHEVVIEGAQLRRVDGELGELVIEVQEVRCHGHRPASDGRQRCGRATHESVGKLAPSLVREHQCIRLPADPDAVLTEDAGGEGVIGQHLRFADRLPRVIHARDDVGLDQAIHGTAHGGKQLPRGLRRERQSEDLVWSHVLAGHQPGHARRHGRGLA